MATLPPMPQQYWGDAVRSDDGVPCKSYVDGWMRRIEVPQENIIVISRPDKGVIWTLDTQSRTYSQVKLPNGLDRAFNPDTSYQWIQDGKERIGGRLYLRFIGHPKEADCGKARELCFVDPKTHIRRRTITFNENGKRVLTIDSLNAVVGPPPREVFELPGGYRRTYHRRKQP